MKGNVGKDAFGLAVALTASFVLIALASFVTPLDLAIALVFGTIVILTALWIFWIARRQQS